MIHFHCPWCQRELTAEDDCAGQAVNCHGCKGRVTVPKQGSEEAASPPHPQKSPYEEEPQSAPRRLIAWVQENFVVQLFLMLVPGLVLIGLGVALNVPLLVVIAGALGSLVNLVGWVWFLVVAFSDSVGKGLFCLLVPCYALFYLIGNFDETRRPFIVSLTGFSLAALAQIAGAGSDIF